MSNLINLRKSGSTKQKFFMVWTPYERFVSPTVHDTLASAKKAARKLAEANPGLAYYVLTAVVKLEATKEAATEDAMT